MPSPTIRFANRTALGLYRADLTLEQITLFEYFVDIARFSHNGVFRIKFKTLYRELRLNRRKTETLLRWLETIELLKEKPRERKNDHRCYFFDFQKLKEKPMLIFTLGIPHSPEYDWLSKTANARRRIEIIKRARKHEQNHRLGQR